MEKAQVQLKHTVEKRNVHVWWMEFHFIMLAQAQKMYYIVVVGLFSCEELWEDIIQYTVENECINSRHWGSRISQG